MLVNVNGTAQYTYTHCPADSSGVENISTIVVTAQCDGYSQKGWFIEEEVDGTQACRYWEISGTVVFVCRR